MNRPRARLLACGLALAAALGACRRSLHHADAARPVVSPSAPALPAIGPGGRSAGCASPGPGGAHTLTTTDGRGITRSYELLVPEGAADSDAQAPRSVTFVFHGQGATAAAARGFGLQRVPGAAATSIFVFPQGVPFQQLGVGWDDACGGYDMVFFDHMLAAVEAAYCVDPGRVQVAGFSWGCDFVTALACCRGDRIRAVAAASCSDDFQDPADPASYINVPCPRRSNAAVRFTHDARDDGGYTARQFGTTGALYRALSGCADGAAPAAPPCVAYGGCRRPVLDCAYPGLGHALPPDWAADTWRFFSQQR